LKELAKDGLAVLPLLALLAGAALAVVFVRRQRTLDSPLMDFRLFRNPTFRTALVTLLLSMLVAGGTYLLVTQYLQLVGGLSPMTAGLYLLPAAFALIVTSVISPIAASRFRPAHVVAAGLVVSALGHVMLATADSTSGIAQVVTGFAFVYGGGGPLVALGTDIVVGSAPPEQAGSASAVSETSTELGMALGVATLGSLGAAVYRAGVELPPGVGDGAGDTLAGALDAAKSLPAEVASALADSGRAAFTDGMNAVGAVGTLLALGSAVMVAMVIKSPPTGAGEEPATGDEPLVKAAE
ncbi:MFS transporter, partial [Streptomyces albidoflavus]